MINIRNIIIALLFSSTVFLISCGSVGDGTESVTGYFGYNSKYQGYTHHAAFIGYQDAEIMAKALVDGINKGNKIYLKATNAIMPQLYLDNGTQHIQENGTCIQNYGYRSYNTTRTPTTSDNRTMTSYITYNNYCLLDTLSPSQYKIIVDKTSRLDEAAYFDGNQYNVYYYELLADTGLELKMQESPMSWDNMTLNGLFLKDSKCYANHNQDCVTNNTTISMDMPDNATKYRFDLYAEETRSNGTIPQTYKRSIKFYHADYGYVTADIIFLGNNITVSTGQKITMQFQDKDCKFSIEEFGTNNFNCDDYQDVPVN